MNKQAVLRIGHKLHSELKSFAGERQVMTGQFEPLSEIAERLLKKGLELDRIHLAKFTTDLYEIRK